MSAFVIHTVDSAPEEARPLLEGAQKKFGFLPNLLGELAAAPAALQAYLTLGDLFARTSLSTVEQQLVLLSVSRANGCDYCTAAHSAGLTMAGFGRDQLATLKTGQRLLDARLEALRVFATAIALNRGHVSADELNAFLDVGYSRPQALEVLIGVAMKTLSNHTNHIATTPLDVQLQPFEWVPSLA